ASEPSTAAGSGTPQCAVIGWPGQIGQTSPAASPQTVKMKSSCGAPGLANSSQDFDRKSEAWKPRPSTIGTAWGLTRPAGVEPAEKALTRPPPSLLSRASARIERAELPVQRKRTL